MRTNVICLWLLLSATMALLLPSCSPRDETIGSAASVAGGSDISADPLPALVDIHGVAQRPFAGAATTAVVLVFTLQDCPIANSYVPALNQFVETYGPRGVRLLLVHVDSQLTTEEALKHAEEYRIQAPVVIDRQHAWVKAAGATRSPEVAVFSPAGKLLYLGRIDDRYAGLGKRRTHVSTHDLQETLEAVLAGRPIVRSKTEAVGCFIPPLPHGE